MAVAMSIARVSLKFGFEGLWQCFPKCMWGVCVCVCVCVCACVLQHIMLGFCGLSLFNITPGKPMPLPGWPLPHMYVQLSGVDVHKTAHEGSLILTSREQFCFLYVIC
jgi:hypothetical protein